MKHKILVVDDESEIRKVLVDLFARHSYGIYSAGSAKEALNILRREKIEVVISDELMPGMTGSEFLSIVRKKYPDTIRIILTGHASLQAAIRAINEGEIYRFLTKPCNVVDLEVTVHQALQHKELMKESQRLLKAMKSQTSLLHELEEQYPGITKVNKNEAGVIILDDTEDHNGHERLMEQIDDEVKRWEKLFEVEDKGNFSFEG